MFRARKNRFRKTFTFSVMLFLHRQNNNTIVLLLLADTNIIVILFGFSYSKLHCNQVTDDNNNGYSIFIYERKKKKRTLRKFILFDYSLLCLSVEF